MFLVFTIMIIKRFQRLFLLYAIIILYLYIGSVHASQSVIFIIGGMSCRRNFFCHSYSRIIFIGRDMGLRKFFTQQVEHSKIRTGNRGKRFRQLPAQCSLHFFIRGIGFQLSDIGLRIPIDTHSLLFYSRPHESDYHNGHIYNILRCPTDRCPCL